jgi:D-glycero-D-manno-heptose 1,7-bisphosphate phosphatase
VRRAVFVDRDGVLNELVPDPVSDNPESPLAPDLVALIPDAAAALRRLRAAGYALVGISNQPAAAKGTVTLQQLERVQARVLELLASEDVELDGFELCFHHPDGIEPELSRPCDCRKPEPGMLLRAARALSLDCATSWVVGDTDDDVTAGRAAGCRTLLVENPGSAHKRLGRSHPYARVGSLAQAADFILRRAG